MRSNEVALTSRVWFGDVGVSTVKCTSYVVRRLRGLLIKKRGRNLRPGQIDRWTEDWFNELGLYRLRGTIRHPKAA